MIFHPRARISGLWDKILEHLVAKTRKNAGHKRKDFSFLCFELLMAVLSEGSIAKETAPFYYHESRTNEFGYILQINNNIPTLLVDYIKKNWTYRIGIRQGFDGHGPYYNGTLDIPLLLIGYSELVYKGEGILSHHPDYSKYVEYIDDFNAVKRMLESIK